MQKTALTHKHAEEKAKLVDFAGFQMPISYPKGIIKEHLHVRKYAGIFDVSHMGEIFLRGKNALAQAELFFTNNIEKVGPGRAAYGVFLKEDGGIVDDVIAYFFSEEEILFCVNAANVEKDFSHLKAHLSLPDVELTNESHLWSQIALQGPKAPEVFKNIFGFSLPEKAFSFLKHENMIIATTGYTGEAGCEIYLPNEEAPVIWQKLLDYETEEFKVEAIGLGARDTLRLEKKYPLYGHELNEDLNPLDAGLKWCIDFNKEFIGKTETEKYLEKGVEKKLICIKALERAIPRDGFEVFSEGKKIGLVSSGGYSPSVEKGIAIALVDKKSVKSGARVQVQIRNKLQNFEVIKAPFV